MDVGRGCGEMRGSCWGGGGGSKTMMVKVFLRPIYHAYDGYLEKRIDGEDGECQLLVTKYMPFGPLSIEFLLKLSSLLANGVKRNILQDLASTNSSTSLVSVSCRTIGCPIGCCSSRGPPGGCCPSGFRTGGC